MVGFGRSLEVDVLARISAKLIITHPLSMDIWHELCQYTQSQVPGGGIVNGYRLPTVSPLPLTVYG